MKYILILLVNLTLLFSLHPAFAESVLDTAKNEMLICNLQSAKREAIQRGYDHVNQRKNRHHLSVEQEVKRVSGRCSLRAIDYALNVRRLLKK